MSGRWGNSGVRGGAIFAVWFLGLSLSGQPTDGQDDPGMSATNQVRRPGSPGTPDEPMDLAIKHAQEQARKRRDIDRQRKIVADSDRLLILAQELNADAQKNGPKSSPQLARKADEIEKLAHAVKDRIRGD